LEHLGALLDTLRTSLLAGWRSPKSQQKLLHSSSLQPIASSPAMEIVQPATYFLTLPLTLVASMATMFMIIIRVAT